MGIHSRVQTRREALGLTREQLSAQLGVHASVLHKIERGDIGVSAERVQSLARLLRTTVAFLYGETRKAG